MKWNGKTWFETKEALKSLFIPYTLGLAYLSCALF